MTRNGYSNDDTWLVAASCDNTQGFEPIENRIGLRARSGDVAGAADELQALVTRTSTVKYLSDEIDYAQVDWTDIVTTWAQDAA
ncbi:hypothetical protein [Tsukamurella tyrosinosolvens]|uniref:hypothetical protein n=1 Tax=Tsukamurella tyrosinosolvens TaxID=57704 RepID=UPI001114B216|nr:hypothetical protein [Tsukamurella tyrosinosolvens]